MRSGAAVENVVVQPRSGIEMRPTPPTPAAAASWLYLAIGLHVPSRPVHRQPASQPATNSAAAQFFAFN